MPVSFLGITSLATFDLIDRAYIENLEYTILLDLEWFIDNNRMINSKTQELVLYNDDYEVHISLNKSMREAYTKALNESNDNETSEWIDSIGSNDIYTLTTRK